MTSQTPGDNWYYARDRKRVGPVPLAQLHRLLADGVLKPEDMVFQEGTQKWRPLATVPAAPARTRRFAGMWKLGLAGGLGLLVLGLLGWGVAAMLRRPDGKEEVDRPEPAAKVAPPKQDAPAKRVAPPLPPGQSSSTQQKRLAQLEQELERAADAGRMDEAARLARQMETLRRQWQGAEHWQAVEARYDSERWQRLARLGQAQQKEAARALRRAGEAQRLHERQRYADAEKAWRDALAIWRKVLGEQHPETAASYNKLAVCLSEQGKFAQALPLHEKALEIKKKVLGEEHPDTATSYGNLAVCLEEQSKFAQALPLHEKALTIRKKVLGEQHPDTARSYSSLAICLHAQGKFAQALPLFEKALAIRRKLLGEQHADTAYSYAGLALCLEAQGKAAQALPLFEKALAIRQKVLGEEHADTADSYTNVAACLGEQGKFAQALPLHEKALAIKRKVLGEEHPHTAASYSNLAACLVEQGKFAQALPLHEKALAIRKKVLGEEYFDTANSYQNLAACLKALGKAAQALPLFRKALDVYRKVLGEQHSDTASSYSNLAVCLDEQSQVTQALPLHEKALDIRRKVLGEEHPDTALSYNNLANCLGQQGKFAQALPLLRKALDIQRKVLGEQHPVTAKIYTNLALCLNEQGKAAEALPLHEKALDIHRKLLGEEHPDTAMLYGGLALCLQQQGKAAQALPLFQKALNIQRKALGEQHALTALSYNLLAQCVRDQGKAAQALPLFEKALDIQRKVLGEQHSHTALSYNNLAECLRAQGKAAQALPLFEKALDISRKVLGEQHPLTALGYNNLGYCLQEQGKAAQALPLLQKALAISREVLGEQHPRTALSCNNLAACLHEQGRQREAIRHWQAALLGHDAGRLARASTGFERSLAGAHLLTPRQGLALAHARLGEADLAWQHAEADLARGLLDDLGGTLTEDAALLARLKKLEEALLPLLSSGKLDEQQKQRRDELLEEQRRLRARLAKDVAERSAGRVWSLERIQKQLADDDALVLWVSGTSENWGCVLRAQGPPHWQRLGGSGPKGSWTQEDFLQPLRLHAALADRRSSEGQRRELSAAVRQRWLQPLLGHLKAQGKLPAVRRLFVVPSGLMSGLPLEGIAPEWTVSYISSGTLLAQTLAAHRPLNASSVLALGDPVFTATKKAEPPGHGLLITVVLPGSNAARADMRGGDVLLDYRGSELNSVEELQPLLAKPERARATLWRDGQRKVVRVAPGPLGVVFDPRSVRAAVRAWRRAQGPVLRGASHEALPGTRFEVETLARLLGKRCRTLLGSDASEQQLDALDLKQFRVLHLATHGKIDVGTPANSALILARDRLPSADERAERAARGQKVYTGELRVGTILEEWKLDADLVVLSACVTGLGRYGGGQGLLGFAYALQKAGARSLVLSRWKVDDTATSLLMLRFYENLLGSRKGSKPLGRALALQEAKHWLRELGRKEAGQLAAQQAGGVLRGTEGDVKPVVGGKPVQLPQGEKPFAHPAFWAAFTLLGDPS